MPVRLLLLFLSVASLLVLGCRDTVIERQDAPVSGKDWRYADTLKYTFELLDTTAHYDLVAEVRHRDDYPFQNLYTRIHTIQPQADTSIQVISLELAEHTGQWHGKCAGHDCKVEITLRENFRIQKPGEYQIWIEQFMRDPAVPGIRGISLALLSAEVE